VYSEATSKSPDRSGSSFSLAHANSGHHNQSVNSHSFVQKNIVTPYCNQVNTSGTDYNGGSSKKSGEKINCVLKENNGK